MMTTTTTQPQHAVVGRTVVVARCLLLDVAGPHVDEAVAVGGAHGRQGR